MGQESSAETGTSYGEPLPVGRHTSMAPATGQDCTLFSTTQELTGCYARTTGSLKRLGPATPATFAAARFCHQERPGGASDIDRVEGGGGKQTGVVRRDDHPGEQRTREDAQWHRRAGDGGPRDAVGRR